MLEGVDYYSPPFTMFESDDYNKNNDFLVVVHDDDVDVIDDDDDDKSEDFKNLKPITKGKPPRHGSGLRHSLSSTRLMQAVANLVS